MSAALRAYAQREADTRGEAGGASTDGDASNSAPLVGKRVLISGLLSRPDLNGLIGEAIAFSSEKGRYTVSVNGEELALKASNLQVQKRNEADSTAFAPGVKVRIKGLSAKPQLNGCGGTVEAWNEEKERYVIKIDGSLQNMLLRAANLERDKREAWSPEMHDPATVAHINQEFERYAQEQMANANPFAQMGITEDVMEQINSRNREEE